MSCCVNGARAQVCKYFCYNPQCPANQDKIAQFERDWKTIKDPAGNTHMPPPMMSPPQLWSTKSMKNFSRRRENVIDPRTGFKPVHAWCGTKGSSTGLGSEFSSNDPRILRLMPPELLEAYAIFYVHQLDNLGNVIPKRGKGAVRFLLGTHLVQSEVTFAMEEKIKKASHEAAAAHAAEQYRQCTENLDRLAAQDREDRAVAPALVQQSIAGAGPARGDVGAARFDASLANTLIWPHYDVRHFWDIFAPTANTLQGYFTQLMRCALMLVLAHACMQAYYH
jgi:hypothetical protein